MLHKKNKRYEKDRAYFRALHGKQPELGYEGALGRVQGKRIETEYLIYVLTFMYSQDLLYS